MEGRGSRSAEDPGKRPVAALTVEFVQSIASRYPGLKSLKLANNGSFRRCVLRSSEAVNSALTGPGRAELRAVENLHLLPHLRRVDLTNNLISFVSDLAALTQLRTLILSGNQL